MILEWYLLTEWFVLFDFLSVEMLKLYVYCMRILCVIEFTQTDTKYAVVRCDGVLVKGDGRLMVTHSADICIQRMQYCFSCTVVAHILSHTNPRYLRSQTRARAHTNTDTATPNSPSHGPSGGDSYYGYGGYASYYNAGLCGYDAVKLEEDRKSKY